MQLRLPLIPRRYLRKMARMPSLLFDATMAKAIRWGDLTLGTSSVPFLLKPWILLYAFSRWRDYAYFKRLRAVLPRDFWGNLPAGKHFVRMVTDRHESLAACLLYDRLRTSSWKNRVVIQGTPPDQLPEWGQRPVVIAFFHTGGFLFLRYWLRAQGIPTAAYAQAVPAFLATHADPVVRAGDVRFGLESIDHTFQGSAGLRPAIRFLVPGRALVFALEGGYPPAFSSREYRVGSAPISLREGAARLAQRTNAILLAASIRITRGFRFEIYFGRPLREIRDSAEATQRLAEDLWKQQLENPATLAWATLEALSPPQTHRRLTWL